MRDTKVTGLDSVAANDRPPFNTLLHWCFDTMVGICTMMIALGLWFAWAWWRRRDIPRTPWFLRAVAISGIAAIVALPDVQEKLRKLGVEPDGRASEAFTAFQRAEIAKWGKVIQLAHVKPD